MVTTSDEEAAGAGPPAVAQPATTFEEMSDRLEKMGYDELERSSFVQRHVAAKVVGDRSREKEPVHEEVHEELGLPVDLPDPVEGDMYVERYKQMQLGGPLSAVRSDASSNSGNHTPSAQMMAAFSGLVPRRANAKKPGRRTV